MRIKIVDNTRYYTFPITDDMIEVDDKTLKEIGKTKQFKGFNGEVDDYDNSIIINKFKIKALRNKRAQDCFPIINRGKLWYDTLTEEQSQELKQWYKSWLDVTETLVEPDKPEWLI